MKWGAELQGGGSFHKTRPVIGCLSLFAHHDVTWRERLIPMLIQQDFFFLLWIQFQLSSHISAWPLWSFGDGLLHVPMVAVVQLVGTKEREGLLGCCPRVWNASPREAQLAPIPGVFKKTYKNSTFQLDFNIVPWFLLGYIVLILYCFILLFYLSFYHAITFFHFIPPDVWFHSTTAALV